MDKQDVPVENSQLTDKEIVHFKQKLVEEKKKSEENVEQYKSRLEEMENKLGDRKSSADHHQANLGTTENARERFYMMLEREQEKQEEINMALDRIEIGSYGICMKTGEPIQKERLEAMPYAKYSID